MAMMIPDSFNHIGGSPVRRRQAARVGGLNTPLPRRSRDGFGGDVTLFPRKGPRKNARNTRSLHAIHAKLRGGVAWGAAINERAWARFLLAVFRPLMLHFCDEVQDCL